MNRRGAGRGAVGGMVRSCLYSEGEDRWPVYRVDLEWDGPVIGP